VSNIESSTKASIPIIVFSAVRNDLNPIILFHNVNEFSPQQAAGYLIFPIRFAHSPNLLV
ncbi:hypothetical protein, partial [Paenibacillus elgii]|uniref:hypothetical protein n=1 Tax=Paenibacillus elgii TaxID=189691 RepID=UPI001ED936C9